LRVVDAAGNAATDTLLVIVNDTEAPVIGDVSFSPMDEDTLWELNLKPFVSDNDPGFFDSYEAEWTLTDPWDHTHELDDLAPLFEFTEPGIWHAEVNVYDADGNMATTEFVIYVNDITSPVISVVEPGPFEDEGVEVAWDASGTTDNDPEWSTGAVFTWGWEPLLQPEGDSGTSDGAVLTRAFDTPGTYEITLTVTDAAGNSAEWSSMINIYDVTPPVVDLGEDRVVDEDTLVWFDIIVTDNHPLFPTGAETFTWTIVDPLGTEWDLYGMRTSFTFLDPGIYTVTAEVADAWNNEGSDIINVTVQDRTPPGAVGDLIVKDDGVGKVFLEWSPSTAPDVAGYRIFRKEGQDGTWVEVATLGPTVTSYEDKVEPGKEYRYRVEAFDTDDNVAPPTEHAYDAVEPGTEGQFPWWMIVVAFILGLAIAIAVGEARLRKQKGREKDEDILPSDEDTLEAVEIEDEVDGIGDLEEAPEDPEEVSTIEAMSIAGLAEMDTTPASEWEEDR
ncbi:MAG: hypothetical protein GQ558_06310, partial [Thermoplasmata archaeon]|nr:hypothetical protein [Thermoplasmata archaeon]